MQCYCWIYLIRTLNFRSRAYLHGPDSNNTLNRNLAMVVAIFLKLILGTWRDAVSLSMFLRSTRIIDGKSSWNKIKLDLHGSKCGSQAFKLGRKGGPLRQTQTADTRNAPLTELENRYRRWCLQENGRVAPPSHVALEAQAHDRVCSRNLKFQDQLH